MKCEWDYWEEVLINHSLLFHYIKQGDLSPWFKILPEFKHINAQKLPYELNKQKLMWFDKQNLYEVSLELKSIWDLKGVITFKKNGKSHREIKWGPAQLEISETEMKIGYFINNELSRPVNQGPAWISFNFGLFSRVESQKEIHMNDLGKILQKQGKKALENIISQENRKTKNIRFLKKAYDSNDLKYFIRHIKFMTHNKLHNNDGPAEIIISLSDTHEPFIETKRFALDGSELLGLEHKVSQLIEQINAESLTKNQVLKVWNQIIQEPVVLHRKNIQDNFIVLENVDKNAKKVLGSEVLKQMYHSLMEQAQLNSYIKNNNCNEKKSIMRSL